MRLFKIFAAALTVALALLSPSAWADPVIGAQSAGQSIFSLDSTGRQRDYTILGIINTSTSAATYVAGGYSSSLLTSVNSWINGHVANDSTSFPSLTISSTASRGAAVLPYAARLKVYIADRSADTTPVCTKLVISGYNYKGFKVTEQLNSISETAQYTKHSYESVTSWSLTGCGGADSDDDFVIQISRWIAVPVPIRSSASLASVVIWDRTSSSDGTIKGAYSFNGSELTFHAESNSVDFGPSGLTPVLPMTHWEAITFRVRASR